MNLKQISVEGSFSLSPDERRVWREGGRGKTQMLAEMREVARGQGVEHFAVVDPNGRVVAYLPTDRSCACITCTGAV